MKEGPLSPERNLSAENYRFREKNKASFVGMAKEAMFMTVYFLTNGSPFRLHQSAANSVRQEVLKSIHWSYKVKSLRHR